MGTTACTDVVSVDSFSASFILWSMLITCLALGLSVCKRTSFGPGPGKVFNRGTLTMGMFLSVVLLRVGLSNGDNCNVLFDSIQMMLAGKDFSELSNSGISRVDYNLCVLQVNLAYVLAPVSSIATFLDLVTDVTAPILLRFQSMRHETFLLTPLNHRTLALARSIKEKKRKACIAFTDSDGGSKSSLAGEVQEIRAFEITKPIEYSQQIIPWAKSVTLVLDSDDEAINNSRASAIQQTVRNGEGKRPVNIYAVTSLYGSDTQSECDADQDHSSVHLYRVDWTRNLVSTTLDRYPLFLRSVPPTQREGEESSSFRPRYLDWQNRMFDSTTRRIVIVGAGHVGTEFLRLALSNSRVHGLRFRFDVFDNSPDPPCPTQCKAERKLKAIAPELLDQTSLWENAETHTSVAFHLRDARSEEFARFIERCSASITYVFVSLEKDTSSSEVALRVREALERGLTHRLAALDEGERQAAFANADRPLVVAVIDHDEVARSLTARNRQGRDRQINVVGLAKDMYSYEQMVLGGQRETGYNERSSHASQVHAKYRLFAYARSAACKTKPMRDLIINWNASFQEELENDKRTETRTAIRLFNLYCQWTPMHAPGRSRNNHEWLLKMEHSRWSTYIRAEGYHSASGEDVKTYFDNSVVKDPHRSDLALLHPRLVAYDKLPEMSDVVNSLWNGSSKSFQDENDEHLCVKKKSEM